MKKTIAIFAICCVWFNTTNLSAQITATWKGGKPGQATEWNCASNWREGRVPNEFSIVFIPSNILFFPVLDASAQTCAALMIEGGASLQITNHGYLYVHGEGGYLDGLTLFGEIHNAGTLETGEFHISASTKKLITGTGRLVEFRTKGESFAKR